MLLVEEPGFEGVEGRGSHFSLAPVFPSVKWHVTEYDCCLPQGRAGEIRWCQEYAKCFHRDHWHEPWVGTTGVLLMSPPNFLATKRGVYFPQLTWYIGLGENAPQGTPPGRGCEKCPFGNQINRQSLFKLLVSP